ncbi:MAG: hypothetical protein ACKO24_14170 [Leptolyngbyaceae cyanobacterium]
MARLYADEQFPREVSEIIVCTNDTDRARMATRIDAAIALEEPLPGKLIRVVRPGN